MFDGAEGDHDEGEGRLGGAGAVGAVDDKPYPPVEAFVAGVVHAEADRGQDARTPLADGFSCGDEGSQTGALCLRAEPVEQHGGVVFAEASGEDGAQPFL